MEQTTTTSKQPALTEFFFSGGTVYHPATIRASSRKEAEEQWQKERVPVEPVASQPTPNTPKTSAPISKKTT